MGNINQYRCRQGNRIEHTITHYPVPRTFSDMEIIRPSSQVSHVERHVELHLQFYHPREGMEERRTNI